jgi:outer membrane protein OmpA-like peptidoglycan-associated protein
MKLRKTIALILIFCCFTVNAFNQSTDNLANSYKIDKRAEVLVNFNTIDLRYDSLFTLKLNYERTGKIEDSLILVTIFQIALESDSIGEHLVYSKTFNFSANTEFTCKIIYAGYTEINYNFSAANLSYVNRTASIPIEKAGIKSAKSLQNKKDAFIFVGSIFEENTNLRLPNVRIIIKDKFNADKQFLEITDAYGTFKDSVFGYQLNERLFFEIYLKKEGYISKSFLFEEQLTEYGTIDLEEYLKKIKLTKAAVGVEIGKAANLYPIYFDLDKSEIRKDAARELDKVVSIMNELPNIKIELSSHTDSRATDRYNLALSQRRANSSQNYLIANGIGASRITSVGYGEKQLTNKCLNEVFCSEKDHSMNRRTEFKIVDMAPIKTRTASGKPILEQKKPLKKTGNQMVFNGRIIDAKSGKPISYVEVVATNVLDRSELYTTKADKDGSFTIKTREYNLGDKLYLNFLISKKDYISKKFNYRRIINSIVDPIYLDKLFYDFSLVLVDLDVDIGKASNMSPILFDLGKADINVEAAKELYQIAAILIEQPSLGIELGSHTDSRGADSDNLKLSQERANATMHYLVSQGVSYSRIKAVGFGEQQPLNKCINDVDCSEEEHAANRRTAFVIKKIR